MIGQIAPPPPKEKGGLFGKALGGLGGLAKVLGVAAAPFTAGASLGIGGAVGSGLETIGGIADPSHTKQSTAIGPLASMQNGPGVELARVVDFQDELKRNPNLSADDYNVYNQRAEQAKMALMKRMGRSIG
jgi:hypothetical protein